MLLLIWDAMTLNWRHRQFQEQYEFVYKALLEALQAGETTIPSNEMETRYSKLKGSSDEAAESKLEEQFMVIWTA